MVKYDDDEFDDAFLNSWYLKVVIILLTIPHSVLQKSSLWCRIHIQDWFFFRWNRLMCELKYQFTLQNFIIWIKYSLSFLRRELPQNDYSFNATILNYGFTSSMITRSIINLLIYCFVSVYWYSFNVFLKDSALNWTIEQWCTRLDALNN